MPPLRRAETVKTAGIVRPLRIAEIKRTTDEGVCSNRSPSGVSQISAGFHYHRLPAGPVDIEAELIRLHAKAGISGLRLRQPERGWTTGKRCAPTRGAR